MKITNNILLTVTSLIFLTAIIWWNLSGPRIDLDLNEPGADNRGDRISGIDEEINVGEFFKRFFSVDPAFSETWPRFRGSDFDNIHKSGIKLIDQFDGDAARPDDPFGRVKIQWSVDLGEGHAGPAIYKGKVYVLDYDEDLKADMLRCFSLKDGQELWRRWYNVNIKRNHGMSRTIPAVTEKYILTVGPRSHVMCMDRKTGDLLWSIDVEKQFEAGIPFWYTGQCPLIDNDVAIIATAGKALLIGVDCSTGEILWETPNSNKLKMSHASVMPWEFKGTKMYVYSAVGGVVGIAAEGSDAGKILWESLKWGCSVVAPSPLCLPDGKVFLTAGYGSGSMVFQVTEENGNWNIEKLDDYRPKDGLSSEMQTPVYYNGLVYGIMPKDAAALRNQMVCVDPEDFRKVVWASGKTNRFGLGPYMIADDKFYILSDDGTLTIARPSKTEFILLDQLKLFDAHDAWAPMAIADGYLLLRDDSKMICLDIKKE